MCTSPDLNQTPQYKALERKVTPPPLQHLHRLWDSGSYQFGVLSAEVERLTTCTSLLKLRMLWSSTSTPPFVFMTWCLSTLYVLLLCVTSAYFRHRYGLALTCQTKGAVLKNGEVSEEFMPPFSGIKE